MKHLYDNTYADFKAFGGYYANEYDYAEKCERKMLDKMSDNEQNAYFDLAFDFVYAEGREAYNLYRKLNKLIKPYGFSVIMAMIVY